MILGIGTDILEIERICRALEKPTSRKFLKKCFTEREIKMYEDSGFKCESLTGGFCAKEAVVKAAGTGFGDIALKDIEILKDERGKPIVKLSDDANTVTQKLGIGSFLVSISHCGQYAVANAIALR